MNLSFENKAVNAQIDLIMLGRDFKLGYIPYEVANDGTILGDIDYEIQELDHN